MLNFQDLASREHVLICVAERRDERRGKFLEPRRSKWSCYREWRGWAAGRLTSRKEYSEHISLLPSHLSQHLSLAGLSGGGRLGAINTIHANECQGQKVIEKGDMDLDLIYFKMALAFSLLCSCLDHYRGAVVLTLTLKTFFALLHLLFIVRALNPSFASSPYM